MGFLNSIARFSAMFSIRDLIDIAVIAFLIYKLIKLMRGSTAAKVLMGIVLVFVTTQLARVFDFKVLYFLLENTMQVGLLALVVVFQPELRKALEKVGRHAFPQLLSRNVADGMETAIRETVKACEAMSWARDGALIVFERQARLDDYAKNGTIIGAEPSGELLRNIFYPKAPLHDGAVIMRDGLVYSAGCMLPLTENTSLSKELGMRHRAGIGMSEHSDAVVVIVSEESGSISVAIDGMIKRHLAPETLERLLRNELLEKVEDDNKKNAFFGFLKVKK